METGGRCEVVGVAEKKRKVEMKLRRVEKWRIGVGWYTLLRRQFKWTCT